jgi:hypothetical protein
MERSHYLGNWFGVVILRKRTQLRFNHSTVNNIES